MKSIWDAAVRNDLQNRLMQLTPDSPARWGRMTAPRMVAHLADSARMALGELAVSPKNLPIRYPPLKQLVIYWMPFPKNAPTAPELVSQTSVDFERERKAAGALLQRLAAPPDGGRRPEHPAFGKLSERAWGVLVYRHYDHHLRQFGV
jgi:hypothetical protein